MKMRMLDLFCGRLGWSKAFLARGWECVGVDLVEPPNCPKLMDYPGVFRFWHRNVLELCAADLSNFDFICASSPCEQFSVHGMKHFHPNPPYPFLGIKLFNETREICELSGRPYVMENVRAAQQFVGKAVHHCGPFYLWGTGVPALMNQGIVKGATQMRRDGRYKRRGGVDEMMYASKKTIRAPSLATIPPELASCVADYAERLLEPIE